MEVVGNVKITAGKLGIGITPTADLHVSGAATFTGGVTVQSASGSPPAANTIYAPNIVKGWINFNGQGTASIRGSFNVSSLTDNGTGTYTVNWDTDFANANYAIVGTAQAGYSLGIETGTPPTAGAAKVEVQAGGSLADSSHIMVIAIGDQ